MNSSTEPTCLLTHDLQAPDLHGPHQEEAVGAQLAGLFGVFRTKRLGTCKLPSTYRVRVESLRNTIEVFGAEIARLDGEVRRQCPALMAATRRPGGSLVPEGC